MVTIMAVLLVLTIVFSLLIPQVIETAETVAARLPVFIGRVEEKMDIEKDNDENIKISFSARYMMEALKSFAGTTVEISFVGEVKPIIIKDKDDDELTQLVLPIRTY